MEIEARRIAVNIAKLMRKFLRLRDCAGVMTFSISARQYLAALKP
jgi:hypothetical protein